MNKTTTGDSQGSQEQRINERKTETKDESFFHEAGLLIKERKASWHNCCRETQKREEKLMRQTEVLKCQNEVDKMNRVGLSDRFGLLKKIGDEAELQLQQ